jgi:hypothetical protein
MGIDILSFTKIAARFEEYLDTNTVDEMGEPLIKTTSSNTAKSREVAARQREEQSSASYMGLYDQAKQEDLDKRLAQQFEGGDDTASEYGAESEGMTIDDSSFHLKELEVGSKVGVSWATNLLVLYPRAERILWTVLV